MFAGILDPAAEGGGEVVGVACCICDDVGAPVVKGAAVRIGKAVGDITLEFAGQRLVPVDAAVVVSHRAAGCLHLSAVKHPVAEIGGTTRIEHHGVGGVMRVRRIHAHQHALFPVGPTVAVGIPGEPEIGCLHDQHAILVKLEAGGGSSDLRGTG